MRPSGRALRAQAAPMRRFHIFETPVRVNSNLPDPRKPVEILVGIAFGYPRYLRAFGIKTDPVFPFIAHTPVMKCTKTSPGGARVKVEP